MISYSFRGTKIDVPKKFIDKLDNNLLKSLASSSITDIYKESIFVDANPNIIELCFGIYDNQKLIKKPLDTYQFFELQYLACISYKEDDDHFDKKLEKWWKSYPVKEYYIKNDIIIPKIINIKTIDNKYIVLKDYVVQNWFECIFKNIICGHDDTYIISYKNDELDVWLNINFEYTNILISIMRDIISHYYDLIIRNNKLQDILIFFGIVDKNYFLVMNNRYERIYDIKNKLTYSFDFKNDMLTFFNTQIKGIKNFNDVYCINECENLFTNIINEYRECTILSEKRGYQIKYDLADEEMNTVDMHINKYFLDIK